MKKHPSSFKLSGDLEKKYEEAKTKNEEETILYEGPVRDLCPLAPNNVNTMAAAAVAGHNLGFENTQGRLIADPKYCKKIAEILFPSFKFVVLFFFCKLTFSKLMAF